MTVLGMVAIAAAASFLSDGMEHYLLYRRHHYKWPTDLPIKGVLVAALMRAALSMIALAILTVTGAITNLGGAAIVGFSLPHIVSSFFGEAGSV